MPSTQTSLPFNVREAARTGDPVSSIIAAERIAPHVSKGRMLALRCHYEHRESLDDFQLSELTSWRQTSIGKRRGELERMGFVEKGERRVSPSSLTNSIVQSYRITRVGIEYYEAHK